MSESKEAKLQAQISKEIDTKKLKQWVANLEAAKQPTLADLARRRLYSVLAGAEEGTLQHDVWRSVHSLEDARRRGGNKRPRANRTRDKIARVGEQRTVADLAVSANPSAGFGELIALGMSDLSFEAVVLRHADHFDEGTLGAARKRLDQSVEANRKSVS